MGDHAHQPPLEFGHDHIEAQIFARVRLALKLLHHGALDISQHDSSLQPLGQVIPTSGNPLEATRSLL